MKYMKQAFVLFGMFLLFSLFNRVSAQEATPSPSPTATIPDPTSIPPEIKTQSFISTTAVRPPPDADCSNGQCVFWVSEGADDAGTDPRFGRCEYSVSENEIYFGQCADGQSIVSGFRFQDVSIPQGSVVAEAYLEFTVDGPYTGEMTVEFHGEKSANSNPFTTINRPDNRPPTNESVIWQIEANDQWQIGRIRQTPDLSTIINEIVEQPSWISRNALTVIVQNVGPTSGPNFHRRVIGYERPVFFPGRLNAARLVIKFQSSVEILDQDGSPVSEQIINDDGWPTPNPLIVKVTLTCPSGDLNCEYPLNFGLIGDESSRFYVYEAALSPDGINCVGDAPANQNTYSTYSLDCQTITIPSGESAHFSWGVWVQPSDESVFIAQTAYGTVDASAQITVPQASIHPVVVMPGLFGSWKNFLGEWRLDPVLGNYDILLDELRFVGYEDGISLFTFPYDSWLSTEDIGRQLGTEIGEVLNDSLAAGRPYIITEKVDIVAHSHGGLVARSYIQSDLFDDDVHRLIMLGAPNLGIPVAYIEAEGLDLPFIKKSLLSFSAWKAGYCNAITEILCLPPTDENLHQYINEQVPAARELFPDRAYLAGIVDGYLVDSENPSIVYPHGLQVNEFLESLNAEIHKLVSRLGVDNIKAIVGAKEDDDGEELSNTELYYPVVEQGPEDDPLWENGRVLKADRIRFLGAGDLRVPSISADINYVDGRIDSVYVYETDDGQDIIHGFMPTQLQQTIVKQLSGIYPTFNAGFNVISSPNPILIANMSPVEIQVIDPTGQKVGVDFETMEELSEILNSAFWRSDIPLEPDFIFINDPIEGEYTIRLLGVEDGNYVVDFEALTDSGNFTLGVFSGTTEAGLDHEFTINYDLDALPALPLSIEWLPPLESYVQPFEVRQNRTIPVRFKIKDALGAFVEDKSILVWVIDPSIPGSAIAAFTIEGFETRGKSGSVRINAQEEYIVNFNLGEYAFQAGKTYIVGVNAYGHQLETTSFIVVDHP